MFAQIVVMKMFREKNIRTQICANNFMALKAAPPFVVTKKHLDEFFLAICEIVEVADSSPVVWIEAGLGSPCRECPSGRLAFARERFPWRAWSGGE